jgi:hypothetical protein
MITSEPSSEDEGWTPIPPDHLVITPPSLALEVRPVAV